MPDFSQIFARFREFSTSLDRFFLPGKICEIPMKVNHHSFQQRGREATLSARTTNHSFSSSAASEVSGHARSPYVVRATDQPIAYSRPAKKKKSCRTSAEKPSARKAGSIPGLQLVSRKGRLHTESTVRSILRNPKSAHAQLCC